MQRLAEDLGQPVAVDNRGGANGIIGMDLTAKSPADGHTFLIIGGGFAINPSIYRKLPFDPVRDFAPVSLVGSGSHVLVVHPSLPARNVEDLIALAKSAPGKITMASAGVGNLTHLAGELFMSLTGTRFVHVPYKGGGPAITDLLGAQVSLYFSTITVALPHVRAGKLRLLAVTTAKRSPAVPDSPTIAEAGVPGYEATLWYGLVGPARIPAPLLERLSGEVEKTLKYPDIIEKLSRQGVEPYYHGPKEFAARVRDEIPKWTKVIKEAGVRIE